MNTQIPTTKQNFKVRYRALRIIIKNHYSQPKDQVLIKAFVFSFLPFPDKVMSFPACQLEKYEYMITFIFCVICTNTYIRQTQYTLYIYKQGSQRILELLFLIQLSLFLLIKKKFTFYSIFYQGHFNDMECSQKNKKG